MNFVDFPLDQTLRYPGRDIVASGRKWNPVNCFMNAEFLLSVNRALLSFSEYFRSVEFFLKRRVGSDALSRIRTFHNS